MLQKLLASSRESITLATPCFAPDRGLQRELLRAIRERGVSVRVLTLGRDSEQSRSRRSSRRRYADLLEAGARIFEYPPAVMHAKLLVVDRLWSVVGSTHRDDDCFGLDDEVLAARDEAFAGRLLEDFSNDLAISREVPSREWRARPFLDAVRESLAALLERQQ